MKDVFIACAVAGVLAVGFLVMKKLDAFLEDNRRRIGEEAAENSLLLAFDDPMIIGALSPLFEEFSKANPDCQLHLFCDTAKEIHDALASGGIDFAFVSTAEIKNDDRYGCLWIEPGHRRLLCEEVQLPVEPLKMRKIKTAVLWKNNDGKDGFSGAMLSLLRNL